MQQRERILSVIFVACLVAWLGWWQIVRFFRDPIEQLETQIQNIDRQIAKHELEETRILLSVSKLKTWKQRSLPPDPPNAQRLYQTWLTDLAQGAGLEDPKVTPGQRLPKGQTYVAVQIALEANGSLSQITTFLHRFYRTDLLHRIVDMKLDGDLVGRKPTITVSLTAEGLAMTDAPDRKWLFPRTELAQPISAQDQSLSIKDADVATGQTEFFVQIQNELMRVIDVEKDLWKVERFIDTVREEVVYPAGTLVEVVPINQSVIESRDAYAALLAANPFVRPVEAVAQVSPDVNTKIDLAQWTIFTAAITDTGIPEAWIYDRFNNQMRTFKEGNELSVDDVNGAIKKIHADHLLLLRDGSTWRLDLGANLRSLRRVD